MARAARPLNAPAESGRGAIERISGFFAVLNRLNYQKRITVRSLVMNQSKTEIRYGGRAFYIESDLAKDLEIKSGCELDDPEDFKNLMELNISLLKAKLIILRVQRNVKTS